MGLAGQNQVRHLYVGTAPAATITSMATLKSTGVSGDLLLLGKDGAAVSAGGDFKLFQKDTLGNIISSDTIKAANVLSSKSVAYTAAVLQVDTVSAITATAGELYTAEVRISGFGSLSQENEYVKKGFYLGVSGDDAEAVVDGLIASLNRNFSREVGATASANPYVAFSKTGSGGSAALVITEKADWKAGFNGNQKSNHSLKYDVAFFSDAAFTLTATTAQSNGVGTGYQVVEMEHFLLGERGDTYRESGYPHNIAGPGLRSTVAGTYDIIELAYWDEGRDEAKKSKKQLTIVLPTAAVPNANVNGVIADLNTILGAASVDVIKAV